MKLYNVPRNTWILLDGVRLFFHRLDGMYSVCFKEGHLIHIAANADVEIEGSRE